MRRLVALALWAIVIGAPANATDDPAILHEYRQRGMTAAEAPVVIRLAEAGNGLAQLVLGQAYLNGEGVAMDDRQGLTWLDRAAHNGYAAQVGAMADYCLLHNPEAAGQALAITLYRSACDAGNAGACAGLGTKLALDPAKLQEGLGFLQKAAQAGDAGGELVLGEVYAKLSPFEETQVARNEAEARRWLQRSAEHGRTLAMAHLGRLYDQAKDYASARHWYEMGAERHDMGCRMALAELCQQGKGGPVEMARAVTLYKAVAATGALNANAALGRIYELGVGLPRDYAEAFKWYDAFPGGLDDATLLHLGQLCEEGKVVPRDVPKARRYYELANTAEGLYCLGRSLATELQPLQDPASAYKWLLVAKAKGSKEADGLIEQVRPVLNEAQRLAAEKDARAKIEADSEP